MGEAAKISLKAIGKQDTHLLSKDPEDSLFNYNPKQHSNFVKYYKVRNISEKDVPNWPFGKTIKVQYNPQNMGDFLSNIWIKLKLPKSTNESEWYCSQIGRHIIKKITMYVDEVVIEEIDDVWCVINDLVFSDESEQSGNNFLLNQNQPYYEPSLARLKLASSFSEMDIKYPIPFFFCGKHSIRDYKENESKRAYFPVCGIHKQKIYFEITFHEQTFFTNITDTIVLDSFDIITEEIKVSESERNFITSENYIMTVQKTLKHPEEVSDINNNKIHINLVPSIPVSSFHWVLRDTKFEDEFDAYGSYSPSEDNKLAFMNRFNFTRQWYRDSVYYIWNINSGYEEISYPRYIRDASDILQKAKFYLNGQQLPRITSNDSTFFKTYIPNRHLINYKSVLSCIYMYSFGLYPKSSNPTGTLDFSGLNSEKTTLEIEIASELAANNRYRVLLYYKGYETYMIKDGFISKRY